MKNIIRLSRTASTNEDAFQLASKGAPHGVAVIADEQVGGKGRLGRSWASPPGAGIYCSVVIRPRLPLAEYPRITLTAGLSLCMAIERLTGRPFGLKWPNDLFCLNRKCGGILVESSGLHGDATDCFAIVGIGLNVNTKTSDFPPSLHATATSLLLETGKTWELDQVFQVVYRSLLDWLKVHERDGFGRILEQWRKRDVLYGRKMQWVTSQGRVITGSGMGPDEEGRLLVRDGKGRLHEVISGDVHLFGQENEKGKQKA